MPELPEVQTTVDGLNETVKGRQILDAWTDYNSSAHTGKNNIKNPLFFKQFKKEIVGTKIKGAKRRGKNVLIELSNKRTILIHMKMTGHLLFGEFELKNKTWKPKETAKQKGGPLFDPFNKWIHFVLSLSGGKQLAFSDLRKFAKVTLIDTGRYEEDAELRHLGPEALEISFADFATRMKKEKRPIKQTLMDQTVLAGVGNIYSDEALWLASIHPRSVPHNVPPAAMKKLYEAMRKVLAKGIDLKGDSDSDYRDVYGNRGKYQETHNAYRKTGKRCSKKGCRGTIERDIIGARSAHFCATHQKRY